MGAFKRGPGCGTIPCGCSGRGDSCGACGAGLKDVVAVTECNGTWNLRQNEFGYWFADVHGAVTDADGHSHNRKYRLYLYCLTGFIEVSREIKLAYDSDLNCLPYVIDIDFPFGGSCVTNQVADLVSPVDCAATSVSGAFAAFGPAYFADNNVSVELE